ncbi:MAG: phosphoserine phosphatase [Acidobacteriota bacterium]|jgi:phosphoserine phosphatase|nr:phosphoserine phosphatase [Acidobacteriota bacterium]
MTPKYRFVFFDVDSTLVTIEGIDVLADGNPEIVQLTEAAMNGTIALDEVYARRLEIIRPTLRAVEALGTRYGDSLVDGAEETIARLQRAGVQVHLVTAGITQAILPLAAKLQIPPRAVHAVPLQFDSAGNYVDFDRHSYLAKAGGKELVVRDILARSKGKSAFVGDGVSDLETKPAVSLFIGFGGVQTRARVKENAEVYVDEPTLAAVLPYLFENAPDTERP